MDAGNEESQDLSTEELPLSGTSSVNPWDDLSDNALLKMFKEPEEQKFETNFTEKLQKNFDEESHNSDEQFSLSEVDQSIDNRTKNVSSDQIHTQKNCDDDSSKTPRLEDNRNQADYVQNPNNDPVERLTLETASAEEVTNQTPTKKRKKSTPFEMFRGRYLNVTDLTSQAWCEQALWYSFTRDLPVKADTTALDAGSSIHMARELEIHDIKSITVDSLEDRFAVKLLNMLTSISALACGSSSIIRELPVFGILPNSNMFVSGIIDEIKYNEKGELQLVELKTRTLQKQPSKAQYKTHTLQVMLYKHLFDALVKGGLSRDEILAHRRLDADKELGTEVFEHGKEIGLVCSTVGELLDIVLLRFQFSDLPLIDSLKIEYCCQATCESFANRIVEMDTDWLNKSVEHYLKFWNGDREVEGVDIEEAWKCRSCPYYDGCEWVEKKNKELTLKNKKNSPM